MLRRQVGVCELVAVGLFLSGSVLYGLQCVFIKWMGGVESVVDFFLHDRQSYSMDCRTDTFMRLLPSSTLQVLVLVIDVYSRWKVLKGQG